MDPVVNILGRRYKRNDWDLDGIRNRRDCQPKNPMRQDEIVHTGGRKQFVYPRGHQLGDTDATAAFKQQYKDWLEQRKVPSKPWWKFW